MERFAVQVHVGQARAVHVDACALAPHAVPHHEHAGQGHVRLDVDGLDGDVVDQVPADGHVGRVGGRDALAPRLADVVALGQHAAGLPAEVDAVSVGRPDVEVADGGVAAPARGDAGLALIGVVQVVGVRATGVGTDDGQVPRRDAGVVLEVDDRAHVGARRVVAVTRLEQAGRRARGGAGDGDVATALHDEAGVDAVVARWKRELGPVGRPAQQLREHRV